MKKTRKVHLIRSETWMDGADLKLLDSILNSAIKDFLTDERIINIQVAKESNGLSRYWIYVEPS